MDVFMTATRKQEIKYSFLFTKYTNFIMLLNSSKIKLNVRFKHEDKSTPYQLK